MQQIIWVDTIVQRWTILQNGNFTKLLILILLAYALGTEAIEQITQVPIP